MISVTKQERLALVFFSVSMFAGCCIHLMLKVSPSFSSRFNRAPHIHFYRKINVNTATVDELKSLPMVGAVRANQIIKARTVKGRFSGIEEIRYIKGFGPFVFNQMRELIVVE